MNNIVVTRFIRLMLTFRSLPQAGFTEPSYEEPTFKFTTFASIEELGTCLR